MSFLWYLWIRKFEGNLPSRVDSNPPLKSNIDPKYRGGGEGWVNIIVISKSQWNNVHMVEMFDRVGCVTQQDA